MNDCLYEEYTAVGPIKIPETVGQYRVIRTIGKGSFAIVVLGCHEKTREYVAIKIISRAEITNQNVVAYIDNEIRLCSRFDHPNIVKVFDVIYKDDVILIIMEYLSNGDLQTVINRGIYFTYDEQLKVVYQITQGLNYLHERGITHRDLKPENILFDDAFHPKLIDFGLSRERCSMLKTFCGTTLYMAPEVISGEYYDGLKADIWSLGIIIHIIGSGAYPFHLVSDPQFIREIRNGSLEIKNQCRGLMAQLVDMCLNFDPKARASTSEMLALIGHVDIKPFKPVKSKNDRRSLPISSLPKLVVRANTPLYGIFPTAEEKSNPLPINNRKRRRINLVIPQ